MTDFLSTIEQHTSPISHQLLQILSDPHFQVQKRQQIISIRRSFAFFLSSRSLCLSLFMEIYIYIYVTRRKEREFSSTKLWYLFEDVRELCPVDYGRTNIETLFYT